MKNTYVQLEKNKGYPTKEHREAENMAQPIPQNDI
jgi:ribonuclease HII